MPLCPLPDSWRKDVIRILKKGETRLIDWTLDAGQEFQFDFPSGWPYQAQDAFVAFLSQSVVSGCSVVMKKPVGETYEFLFPLLGADGYGKILLTKGKDAITIFSAHKKRFPKLKCDN